MYTLRPAVPVGPKDIVIAPQKGPQAKYVASNTDITIFGGAASGGKSFGSILSPLRNTIANPIPGYQCIILRRYGKQVMQIGGIYEIAQPIYLALGAKENKTYRKFEWRNGTDIRFDSIGGSDWKDKWKGVQAAEIIFEELTEYEEEMFFWIFSRNRSASGAKTKVRGTTNPDADSWVKRLLAPWVDEHWPLEDRAASGEVRQFIRSGNSIVWLPRGQTHPEATNLKFISSSIYDNKILMQKDPSYINKLRSLPLIDRRRLLDSDWTIRPSAGNFFKKNWFPLLDAAPTDFTQLVRYWDFAATAAAEGKDPDWTVGTLVGKRPNHALVVLDVVRERKSPAGVEETVKRTAERDTQIYGNVAIWIEQEAGSSGPTVIDHYRRTVLQGYETHSEKPSTNKQNRAKIASAQAEIGNISILKSPWNEAWLNELEAFPTEKVHDDQVDSACGAVNQLVKKRYTSGDWLEEFKKLQAPPQETSVFERITSRG